jgi:hypothetical protein
MITIEEPPAARWRRAAMSYKPRQGGDTSACHVFIRYSGMLHMSYLTGAVDKVVNPVLHSSQALIYGIFLLNLLVYNICAK